MYRKLYWVTLLQGLKTAIIEGDVIGGTCVNRGCVPSKALLAVSGRMRELQNEHHLKALGLQVLKSYISVKTSALFLKWKFMLDALEYYFLALNCKPNGCG